MAAGSFMITGASLSGHTFWNRLSIVDDKPAMPYHPVSI